MRKRKKTVALLLLLGLGLTTAKAQQAATATGGSATGSGGTASYSIGQVFYKTNSGTNGSVSQGLQQAYEISVVLGVEEQQISLNMLVYPNPTTDYLTLAVGNIELSSLSYQLYDSRGQLIESKQITATNEAIRTVNLPSALYFLKVMDNNKEVKVFKIIKK